MFERDAQRDHESDDEIAFQAEGFEDGFLRAGQIMDPLGVLADDAGEHHVEPGKDQQRQGSQPPDPVLRRRQVMDHAGRRDLRADRRPQAAVDGQQMYLPNLAHVVRR